MSFLLDTINLRVAKRSGLTHSITINSLSPFIDHVSSDSSWVTVMLASRWLLLCSTVQPHRQLYLQSVGCSQAAMARLPHSRTASVSTGCAETPQGSGGGGPPPPELLSASMPLKWHHAVDSTAGPATTRCGAGLSGAATHCVAGCQLCCCCQHRRSSWS